MLKRTKLLLWYTVAAVCIVLVLAILGIVFQKMGIINNF